MTLTTIHDICTDNIAIAVVSSEPSEVDSVVKPDSIMVHHGFRSEEVRRAKIQNTDYTKQHHTPHYWLLTKKINPTNSTKRFYWLTHSTSILVHGEHTDIHILQ